MSAVLVGREAQLHGITNPTKPGRGGVRELADPSRFLGDLPCFPLLKATARNWPPMITELVVISRSAACGVWAWELSCNACVGMTMKLVVYCSQTIGAV